MSETWEDSLNTIFNASAAKVVKAEELDSIYNTELKKIMTEAEFAEFKKADEALVKRILPKKILPALHQYNKEESPGLYSAKTGGGPYASMSFIKMTCNRPYEELLSDSLIQKAATAFTAAIAQSKDYSADVTAGTLKPVLNKDLNSFIALDIANKKRP